MGYSDVDLALSEDHGWVEFGPTGARQTADVASWVQNAPLPMDSNDTMDSSSSSSYRSPQRSTIITSSAAAASDWQRRAMMMSPFGEDVSRELPPPIRLHPLANSWLYVNGQPVVCHPRILAVAAAVTAIQPGASPNLAGPSSAPSSEAVAGGNPRGDWIPSTAVGLGKHWATSAWSSVSMQVPVTLFGYPCCTCVFDKCNCITTLS